MKKIKGELTIKAFTDGRNTKVVVTGPKDIKARQLGNFSCTGTARCHEGDYEDNWIGLCIALGRALQVSKENIEKLVNALCEKKSLVGAVYKDLGMITREQVCPNGKVVYYGLRFEPKKELLRSGYTSETWAFEIDSTEIKDGDITWRDYKVVEKKFGEPNFPLDGAGAIVRLFDEQLAFITGYNAQLCLYKVRLLRSGATVELHKGYVKPVSITAYKKVVSRWKK